MVAAFLWNEAYDEVERELVDRHFVLGWYEAGKNPLEATQTVNGVELLFIVTKQQAENFRGKTIDFDGDKFRFLDA